MDLLILIVVIWVFSRIIIDVITDWHTERERIRQQPALGMHNPQESNYPPEMPARDEKDTK